MLGLNFSHRETIRLGIDPDEAFSALLIHLKPSLLRLSLYWDEIAPEPGVYDFATTQTMLDRAQQHGCKVLLTVGFKPQRHPSFHPPQWLAGAGPERLSANLLMMLERSIALLADYNTIDAWEVEHLPLLSSTEQPQGWSISKALLRRQITVIRDVDPRHRPVVVGHPGGHLLQRGWREALVAGDVLGASLQPLAQPEHREPTLRTSVRERSLAWQLSIQAALAVRFGRRLWVTELIVDPEARDSAGDASELGRVVDLAQRVGAERVYLRGVERWLLMRDRGETQQWEQAQALFRTA